MTFKRILFQTVSSKGNSVIKFAIKSWCWRCFSNPRLNYWSKEYWSGTFFKRIHGGVDDLFLINRHRQLMSFSCLNFKLVAEDVKCRLRDMKLNVEKNAALNSTVSPLPIVSKLLSLTKCMTKTATDVCTVKSRVLTCLV